MSVPEKGLTTRKTNEIRQWPCDGIARYVVKGSKARVAYSAAYESVFKDSGGQQANDGHKIFTREGLRRIAVLNDAYMRVAHEFVIMAMTIQNQIMEDALKLAEQKKSQPETEPESQHEIQHERTPSDPVPAG